jgi:pimeloyl-ACP methyl ester carboxylesterase
MSELIMGYLDAADTTFSEQGSGVPVVLVHGTLCDHRIWDAQRENIASAYRHIALNLRYHGTEHRGRTEDSTTQQSATRSRWLNLFAHLMPALFIW